MNEHKGNGAKSAQNTYLGGLYIWLIIAPSLFAHLTPLYRCTLGKKNFQPKCNHMSVPPTSLWRLIWCFHVGYAPIEAIVFARLFGPYVDYIFWSFIHNLMIPQLGN